MMNIEFLEANQIPENGAEESFYSTPSRLYFLEEKYIRRAAVPAGIPEREMEAARDRAGEF